MTSSVSGSAAYRERMVLPPGAVFEAVLEDVSRADAAAEVLGSVRLVEPAGPPFDFQIEYDPARIDPTHTYAVRARILVEDGPIFVSDQHHPVLTREAPAHVDIPLRRVGGQTGPDGGSGEAPPPRPAPPAPSTASLLGTYWKLIWLPDTPVSVVPQQREPHLVMEAGTGRVHGAGGCNRLTGEYELDGDSLRFGPVAATMMACVDGMETESAFLRALETVTKWRVEGQELELSDDSGRTVARCQAVYLH